MVNKKSSQSIAGSVTNLQDRVTLNIKILLALRSSNQKKLAEGIGLSATTLSEKFSGKIRWNLDDIENASEFLHVNPEALVAGHGFEPWTSGYELHKPR
ncbi:helix-turn-helix domain-containing protein [Bifidobacterium dentium]|uniref:helix-turn-helix domain-containing protein n=1 Tax=Bifidobacterium dentium TaxID=1689 RepID=UPI003D178CDF